MIVGLCYDLLFIIPLTLAVSPFVMPYLMPEDMPVRGIAIALITAVGLSLIKHLKRRERLLVFGTLAILLLAFILYHPPGERLDLIANYFWIFKVMLSGAVCFLAGELAGHFRKIRSVLALAGILLLPVLLFTGNYVSKLSVCMIFLYALLTAADLIERRSVKEGDTDPAKHLVFISPFLLVIFIIAAFIRIPSAPYDWGFVKKISQAVESRGAWLAERIFAGSDWDSNAPFIGFSDRGGFGGDIGGAGYPVMEISSSASSDLVLYLAGKTFDRFDGKVWSASSQARQIDEDYDTLETVSAVLDRGGDGPSGDLMKSLTLKAEYKDMKTDRMFLPLKRIPGSTEQEKGRYRTVYYRLNRDTPLFEKMTEDGHTVTDSGLSKAVKECGISSASYDMEGYGQYRQQTKDVYLTGTELSPELKSYMDEVLSGADSDYEKLCRIEETLRSFRYTDRPGDLPKELESAEDYLDYFMLQKKEGYCSYFATAFVLLARAYGIPARYVQGYRADVGNKIRAEVSSSEAHAWPEAYIEGIGWLNFEPTPGYARKVSWKTEEEMHYEGASDVEFEPPVTQETESAGINGTDEKPAFSLKWYHIAAPAAGVILFALILYGLDGLLKKRRYQRMSDREKSIWICKRNLELLARMKAGIRKQETLTEYRERAGREIPPEYLDFCKAYEEILYSGKETTKEERIKLEEDHEKIRAFVRKNCRGLMKVL